MRLVVYAKNFLPDMGGLERNTFTLATALAALGHEVTVLTGTLETAGAEESAFPFKVVRGLGLGSCFSAIGGADVTFVNGGISLKICPISFLLGKKYMPIYANPVLYQVEDPGFLGMIRGLARKYLAQKSAVNITLSQYAQDMFARLLPAGRATVLLNPIDGELERAAVQMVGAPPQKKFDLLFAGRIIAGKGVFLLVDALKKLSPGLSLKTAFAGDGSDREALLAHAAAQKVPIEYLGRLDGGALIEAYLGARALVVPSTTHGEGNPLVIAEAISLGVPVIASDQGPMIEAVGAAGLIFKSGDAGDLAEKIALLFKNGQLAEKTAQTHDRKQGLSYGQYRTNLANLLAKYA